MYHQKITKIAEGVWSYEFSGPGLVTLRWFLDDLGAWPSGFNNWL